MLDSTVVTMIDKIANLLLDFFIAT